MRIVVDFQGAQTGSRFRGIGHYSTELVKALIRRSPQDEIILALNGLLPDSIEPIRAEFDGLLPQENIRVWYAAGPIEQFGEQRANLREVAEAVREYFLSSLEPDLILIVSIFEGLDTDAVLSVKKFVKHVPVAAVFYDFTPLYIPDEQFRTNPAHRSWYRERIESLRNCDLLLAISESSRHEVIDQLGFAPEQVANIFGGMNESFTRRQYTPERRSEVLDRHGVSKPFILYVGGVEKNKNLERLIEALACLPDNIKQTHQFVCAGKRDPGETELIRSFARDTVSLEMINIAGFVSQSELIDLYNLCSVFVFPSLREGLGLPPFEAMSCGAPTIVSNRTSLPEVVQNADALFDPHSAEAIADKLTQVLTNPKLRVSLVERGLERVRGVTWDATGSRAWHEIQTRFVPRRTLDRSRRTVLSHTSLFRPNERRILVQKLDHHGDFLLGLPAMAKIRARYPHARLEALVGKWNRAAAEACGLFDEIHTFDFFKARSSIAASLDHEELNALIGRLPYYDYAIDLRRQSDTRSILVRLNAYQYFGYRTGEDKIDHLLTHPLEIHPDAGGERSYFDETHTCEQMLRIIDALPFDVNDYVQLPELGKRAPARAGAVAIFPVAGNDSRQWYSEYFGLLIKSLAANRAVTEVNLFCGAIADAKQIPFEPDRKVRIKAGLSFSDLFTELSGNIVCVGNNSFGVHLAGYAGCRTIGIYSGHELPQQWGPPFGDSLAITVDAPCAPCHLPDRKSCPHDLFCLEDISVETVKTAVLHALAGDPIKDEHSRITRNNPASSIKPLVDAVNKSKFIGKVGGLTDEQKIAFAAAVSVNFPERISARRCVYFDVTGLLGPVDFSSIRKLKKAHEVIENLRSSVEGLVVSIATGPHDHEFYAVDLERIDETLYFGDRFRRIIRPVAGDIYIGLDAYPKRNPAQWNLLSTWRQMGVLTLFGAPDPLDLTALDGGGDQSAALMSYLFSISHFDGIVVSDDKCARLRQWIEGSGPPRLRKIALGGLLELIEMQAGYISGGTQPLPRKKRSGSSVGEIAPTGGHRMTQQDKDSREAKRNVM